MMRVTVFGIIASILMSKGSVSANVFRPSKFTFNSLLKDDNGFDPALFKKAMTQVGMISVTGLFASTQVCSGC
jgi:hypothetical protein